MMATRKLLDIINYKVLDIGTPPKLAPGTARSHTAQSPTVQLKHPLTNPPHIPGLFSSLFEQWFSTAIQFYVVLLPGRRHGQFPTPKLVHSFTKGPNDPSIPIHKSLVSHYHYQHQIVKLSSLSYGNPPLRHPYPVVSVPNTSVFHTSIPSPQQLFPSVGSNSRVVCILYTRPMMHRRCFHLRSV